MTEDDKIYAGFAEKFEEKYISQGFNKNRSIEETLDIGWELLSLIPRKDLKRIKEEYIQKYLKE